ncbi:hypothetical protein EON79_10160 [bacterium]|nr:MAG: hypothetical protein EON79_10160 [bacterium]
MDRPRLLAAALAVVLMAAVAFYLWPRENPLAATPASGTKGDFYYTGPVKAKDGESWGWPGGAQTEKPKKPTTEFLIKL